MSSARAQTAGGTLAPSHGVTRLGRDSLRAAVGFRVRVTDTASSKWHIGTLGTVNDETLVLHGRDDERIPLHSVVAVQRSTGRARYNPTVVGFVVGMVAGAAAGVTIGNAQRQSDSGTSGVFGFALGAGIGAGLGALVGRALAPEHWRDIRLR